MILILGGNGFIGTRVQSCLRRRSLSFQTIFRSDCDYYDVDRLFDLIQNSNAKFLINAAGYVGRPNVDACEQHKPACLLGNAVLPGVIREATERAQLPWAHFSSACIFDGPSPQPSGFRETDPPNFCFGADQYSFYSGAKALGEDLLDGADRCYIWRLRMPFEAQDGPQNYLSKLLRYPRLVDARNSLSHLPECIEACIDCFERELEFGTYHMLNTGSITTTEVVSLLAKHVCPDRSFEFFDTVEQFMSEAAATPRSNCIIDNSKARAGGLTLSPVEDAIESCLLRWQSA